MELNYFSVLLATVAQFVCGALWYSLLFGKTWGKIHGFDKLSKETQQKMMKEMGPYYGIQFLLTLITSLVLAIFITYLPADWNVYALAGFFWIGFVMPAQISAIIFGGTEKKWIMQKVLIQACSSLICLEVAAIILKSL